MMIITTKTESYDQFKEVIELIEYQIGDNKLGNNSTNNNTNDDYNNEDNNTGKISISKNRKNKR